MHPKLKENYSYLFDLETELAKSKQNEPLKTHLVSLLDMIFS